MGKDEKKTHRKFHRDQKNVCWIKSGEPISGVRFTKGWEMYFSNSWEISNLQGFTEAQQPSHIVFPDIAGAGIGECKEEAK